MLDGMNIRCQWALLQIELAIDPDTADSGNAQHEAYSLGYSMKCIEVPAMIASIENLAEWFLDGANDAIADERMCSSDNEF